MERIRFIVAILALFHMATAVSGESKGISSTLVASSYDSAEPPLNISNPPDNGAGKDKKTKIFISFFLMDILSINTAEQIFTADFRVQLHWQDPRLAFKSQENRAIQKNLTLENIWHPDIRFINSQKLETLYNESLQISETGEVTYIQRYLGDFSVKLALKDFPRDTQKMSIVIIEGQHFADEIEFIFDPTWSGTNEDLTIAEWSIVPQAADDTPITFSSVDSLQSVAIPSMIFKFNARRHAGYYIWKVIVPLILIVLMAFAVFYIDPAELGAQVTISTASVITVIAFHFSLGYLLPKISYLTRLDSFILGSTVFVFLALAESIVTSAMSTKNKHALARKIDLWSRWLFPSSYILLFIISYFI